jgi:hypothetical protein
LRERVGTLCQIAGLVLMPLAFVLGWSDRIGVMSEMAGALVGLVLIFLGRGLRGGGPGK